MTDSTACVANIGPRGRQQRRRVGIQGLAIGAGVSAALVLLGAPRWLRLVVIAPFAVGAVGIFQAYEQTCIMLAAQGTRDLDSGAELVADPLAARQIQRQVYKVYAESILTAALLTAAVLALPRRAR